MADYGPSSRVYTGEPVSWSTVDQCWVCTTVNRSPDAIEAERVDDEPGLRIVCTGCDKRIVEPGALYFGVPVNGHTKKLHVCVECAPGVEAYIGAAPPDFSADDCNCDHARELREAKDLADTAIATLRAELERRRYEFGDRYDEVALLRAKLAEVTAERDGLTACLDMESESQWWQTYRAALTGLLAYSGDEPTQFASATAEASHHADAAHGKRGTT